jgi:peptidoglycan/xylan/chitin deacetylase (PgdA/CDA1 family)
VSAFPLKRALKHASIRFFKLIEMRPRRYNGALSTLYHEVSEAAGDYSISTSVFDAQIEYLRGQDVHWHTATGLAENLGKLDSPNHVCVTFDDGDSSALDPTLALVESGGKCTHFMIPGRIERKQKSTLSWSQVRELDAAGVEIGSHSFSHPWLTRLSDDELEREVADSRRLLEDKLGKAVTSFAYPYGDYNARVIDAVRKSGYRCAFSTRHIYVSNDMNRFTIPRFEPLESVEQLSEIHEGCAANFYRLLAFFVGSPKSS